MSVLSAFSFLVTRLSGFLVCILWYYFLCLLFCFEFVCFFFHFSQKQEPDRAKPIKTKMQKKGETIFQLVQLCSQIVFLILGGGLKNAFLAENTITIVVSAFFEKGKIGQKMSKRLS